MTFWARENGYEIGSRETSGKRMVCWDDRGRAFSYDIPSKTSFDDEDKLKRIALKTANARVFNRKGLVVRNAQRSEGKNDE